MSGIAYCTREQVKAAVDIKSTARLNQQVDRAVASASRAVERLCHRKFHPTVGTRYFDWPPRSGGATPAWRLWLDDNEVLSITTLTSGGTVISPSSYILEPNDDGPPYSRVEMLLSSTQAFSQGDTHQRAVQIDGVFGGWHTEEAVSTVTGTITAAHGTLTFNPEQVGVGDTVHIDDEYIHLTDVAFADSGQQTINTLTASVADTTVTVTDGTAYAVGEVLRVDSEIMLVRGIVGNNLTVERAYDASVLAAHTSGVDIYAERAYTAQRGALGSTAAVHTNGTVVYRLTYPDLVVDLAVAEAINRLEDERAAYARPISNLHKSVIEAPSGLQQLREDVYWTHARKIRTKAI